MAVLRPKHFATVTLTGVSSTIHTAGAAPTDGSARCTGFLTLANPTGGTVACTITKAGATIIAVTVPAGDTYIHPKPVILSGTVALAGIGNGVVADYAGLEATDS